ncbi:ArnT family glycosyltransferase [Engelhardtia mirabilis]|uniref:Glycosyltransferase RgtA/B/C/D-like domain-containing protein n=1 Tax=Engelhardtia mirabilis TaxID=2528011 RepID=A0A518BJD7_9BACT|nr:hypothetical protein Pla133_21720 [Planctomycetes bacterium Pla133]QDV01421.1 hypothetical protein Pla86_21720 [Planctomycetes bacterium Pla86]
MSALSPDGGSLPAPRAKRALLLILLLGLAIRLVGFTDPWSGRADDFHSHFGAFATGGPATNFAEHGLAESLGMPYDWRLALEDGTYIHGWYSHHPALYMWLSGASVAVFGLEPWALRLPALLLSLFSILAVERLASFVWGRRIGVLAALFMAVLPYSVRHGMQVWTEPAIAGTTCLLVRDYLAWLRDGRLRHLVTGAGWLAAGGLLDWPAHFILPAIGLHALVVCVRDGGWPRLRQTLILPVASLATIGLHAAHMHFAVGAEGSAADRGHTLSGVMGLPEGMELSVFVMRQLGNVLRYCGGPATALLAAAALWQSVLALRGRFDREDWMLPALALPGVMYVALFPGRSHNHDFFLVVSLGYIAISLALAWTGVERLAARALGRSAQTVTSILLVMLGSWCLWLDTVEWFRHRSPQMAELVEEPWLAEWIDDPDAVILTHMGRGMALPFYSRAQVVHSVDRAARLRYLCDTVLPELKTGTRVAMLVDLTWAPALADWPQIEQELRGRGELRLFETEYGPFALVDLSAAVPDSSPTDH